MDSQNQDLPYDDWLLALQQEWISEGRSKEQIYGVENFLSGKGSKITAHQQAAIDKTVAEALNIVLKTAVNNDVAGPVKWQIEDMLAALTTPKERKE